ncbi:MAG: hypothetical protein QM650_10430 [Microlunatus sp.]
MREAAVAVFEARAAEATELGRPMRAWPPSVVAHSHWGGDFARAAVSGDVALSLDEAVAQVNAWIAAIGDRL